jgi:hypothetical protein
LVEVFDFQIGFCGFYQMLTFFLIYMFLGEYYVCVGKCLNLHKNQKSALLGYDIHLKMSHPPILFENGIVAEHEKTRRSLFTSHSEQIVSRHLFAFVYAKLVT